MRARANRNILAAMCIIAGVVLIAVAPVAADGEPVECVDVSVNFDDAGLGALSKGQTTLGPLSLDLSAGTYDVVLISSDPTHAPGAFTDQQNESWFIVLDNGYTSPKTPDIPDAELSVTVVVENVDLGAATAVTAVWAGQAPSHDSVHAAVTFRCAAPVVTTTTTSSTAPPTTIASSTTAAETTTTTSASTTTAAPTTIAAPTTTSAAPTTVAGTGSTIAPTTAAPTTTAAPATTAAPTTAAPTTAAPATIASVTTTTADVTAAADGSEETSEDNPELGIDGELAATGVNTNLAVAGVLLIALGFGLVVSGAIADDRRQLATVRSR